MNCPNVSVELSESGRVMCVTWSGISLFLNRDEALLLLELIQGKIAQMPFNPKTYETNRRTDNPRSGRD